MKEVANLVLINTFKVIKMHVPNFMIIQHSSIPLGKTHIARIPNHQHRFLPGSSYQ